MLYFYLGGNDITANVTKNSLRKRDELQQRVDSCSFSLEVGATRPTQNQEVIVYDGYTILSLSGTTLILNKSFVEYSKFRAGDDIWLGVGESTLEKVTIDSINGETITLTSSADNAHSLNEKMGKKIFGGTVQGIDDENLHSLSNLIINVECADYTKIFDKKLLNDSWKDRTSFYIINSAVNQINLTYGIDNFEYANSTALRAVWVESVDGDNPILESTDYKEEDNSAVFPWTHSGCPEYTDCDTGNGTATPAVTSGGGGYTPAYLTGGTSAESTVATWNAVTDGEFRANFDGTIRDVTGIDFDNRSEINVTGTPGSATFVYDNFFAGQNFLAIGTSLNSVLIKVFSITGSLTGNAQLDVYTVDGSGFPTGSSLGSKTIDSSTFTSSTDFKFTFASPITVVIGTEYAYVLKYVGGDDSNNFSIATFNSAPYADGIRISSADSGANWSDRFGYDLYFIVDFLSPSNDMDDVAQTIQTAIRASTSATETVAWVTDHFLITSSSTASTSQVSVFSAVPAGSGTDISGATDTATSATFSATVTQGNVSDITGIASGTPNKGLVCFWYKQADYTVVNDIKVKVGSDSSNYTEITFTPSQNNDWNYARLELIDGTVTGTPDWTAFDYSAITVTETASSNIIFDGLRFNATGSFTFDNVQTGVTFKDFRAGWKKPTAVMQKLADQNRFYWYIDYDKDIHFFASETNIAPFNLSNSSNNFNDLRISLDAEKIINRQVVRGGNETSSTKTVQDIKGDGKASEWFLRNKFRNFSLLIDTTSGGSFSTVSTGVDFLTAETSSAYFTNFNAQSFRSANATTTPPATATLRARYHEVIPIVTLAKDNTSINTLKGILGNDGIFDGATVVDRNLKTRSEAEAFADSQINKYSNPIVSANFITNFEGLRSGQIIKITDTTSGRNVDQNFIIQKVSQRPISENVSVFSVTCASTVFGIMELLQKLLRDSSNIEVDENETIFKVETFQDEITTTESWKAESQNITTETVSATESWETNVVLPPFLWGATTSNKQLVWNLGVWG